MAEKIQTFIFTKEDWSLTDAKKWLSDNSFRNDKVDETANSYRFRQFSPTQCKANSFKTLTQNFPKGISAVVCEPDQQAARPASDRSSPELRHFPLELRVTGDAKAPVLEGHAAVFNLLSEDFGGWRERIAPGAFDQAIQGDVRSLWNHDNNMVLGRTASGTLQLNVDARGLAYRVTPPDTSWFRDRLVSLKRGDVTGASFGFYTESDAWGTEGGMKVRTIVKVAELLEISPGVTFPAYPQASTEMARRSLEAFLEMEKAPTALAGNDSTAVEMELRKRRLRLRELTL